MRDNINVILCENIDNSLTNISNIVDVIPMQENSTISFTVVMFINGVEWEVKNFGLYFYIEALELQKMTYLGSTEFQNAEIKDRSSNGNLKIGSKNHCSQSISELTFENFNVPGPGAYELQVYKYENEEMIDLSAKEIEECISYAKDDKLVANYSFEVYEK